MSCQAPGCELAATAGWQRWASPAELDALIAAGELPPNTTSAQLMVLACADHRLMQGAGQTHEYSCEAPPTCTCSVNAPDPEDPEEG